MIEPLHRDVGCMWDCLILLEPLQFLIHTMMCSKCPPELVKHISVMLFCGSDCLLACFFKPKQSDYFIFWDSQPCVSQCKGLCSTLSETSVPQYTQLLLLTCPQNQKCALLMNQTSSRKSGSSSIFFSNHQHVTKHFSMSAGVSLCLIWIRYGYSWISFFKILCNDAHENKIKTH